MSSDSPKTPHDELEARLTALLLGELSVEEAAAWKAAIATNPELAKLHDRLKHAVDLVREVAATPSEPAPAQTAPLKLSEERRQKLLTHFKTVRPKELVAPRRHAMPWLARVAAAAAVMVLLIAIALPNFVRSRSTSQSNAILNNLRQLDGAKQQWALENKKSAADIPTVDDLKPYLGRNGRMPPSIAGETYNLGTVTAEVDATKARELLSKVQSGRPSNAMPGQQVHLAANGEVTYVDKNTTQTRIPAREKSELEELTRKPVPVASISPPMDANQGQIVLPTPDQSADWRQTEQSKRRTARGFNESSGVAGGTGGGGTGGKDGAIGDPKFIGTLATEQFANVAAPPPASESLSQPITGQSDTSIFRRRYGLSPSVGESESRLARSGSVATAAIREKLNEVADYASPLPPRIAPATTLPANAPAEGRTTTPPAIDPSTGLPVVINGQLPSKNSDVASYTDGRKVPGFRDLSLAKRFFRSESGPSETTDRGQGFLTSTNQPQQPGLLAFDKLGVVSNDFYSFGVQPSLGKSGFSSAAAWGDHNGDGSIPVFGGALALNQAKPERVGLPPVAYYEAKNDRITEGERIAPESKVHSVDVAGNINAPAKSVNRTRTAAREAAYDSSIVLPSVTTEAGAAKSAKSRKDASSPAAIGQLAYSPSPEGGATQLTDRLGDVPARTLRVPDNQGVGLPPVQDGSVQLESGKLGDAELKLKDGIKAGPQNLGEEYLALAKERLSAQVDRRGEQEAKQSILEQALVESVPRSNTNAAIPQPEIQTSENNFSTFSLNVSDVSFKLAAASLEKGQMPDVASVRSEEFINAFDYCDPEPTGGALIAFAWERARYPFAHNRDLLRFSLKTAAAGRQTGRPLNIVLLLDNSGSMERADRVQIIREALRVLASQLQPQDKLSVITFARTARLVVDGISGDKAGEVAEQVSGVTPQGGTNLEEAMNLAYQTAAKHYLANGINRVVLLTDGAANLGDVEPDSLKQKVEVQRKQGIALDCFGIGWEGFNDDLLEVLSRNGDGRYGFINSPEEAATDFVGQLAGALQVAASDVKVQVEFNPRRVTTYRQIGYAKHQLTKEQFRDNTVDAAEIAAQEAGNALYTVEVNPAGEGPLCTVRVRYKIPGTTDYREQTWDVPFTGNALSLEQSSPAMRLAGSASAFSEWLVASPFAGEVTPDRVLGVLSGVPEVFGADSRPKKLEWMIRQAKSLEGK